MLFKRIKLTMKYFLQGSIIFLLLIMLMPSYAEAREADSTAGLHVTIDVKPNGNLIVTEQFDITAGGYIFKHGIYRRIPLLLEGRYGGEYLAGFKMLSAQLNNTSIPYQATISNGNAIIKVGDPKKELDYGPASFIITYQLSDEIRFFENYDELYFNAIPHQWATGVFQVSCRLKLNFMPPAFLLFSQDSNLLRLSLTNLVTFLTNDLGYSI